MQVYNVCCLSLGEGAVLEGERVDEIRYKEGESNMRTVDHRAYESRGKGVLGKGTIVSCREITERKAEVRGREGKIKWRESDASRSGVTQRKYGVRKEREEAREG